MQASCETISWLEEIGVDFQQSFTKDHGGHRHGQARRLRCGDQARWEARCSWRTHSQAELENLGVNIDAFHRGHRAHPWKATPSPACSVDGPDGKQEHAWRSAVVLAMGGFGGSKEYCDQLVPAINKIGFQYQGNALNTGDGMTMAKAVGAALYDDCVGHPERHRARRAR